MFVHVIDCICVCICESTWIIIQQEYSYTIHFSTIKNTVLGVIKINVQWNPS